MMRALLVAAVLAAVLACPAHAAEETPAIEASTADCLTTAAAFELLQVVERNPLGLGPSGACAAGLFAVTVIARMPEPDRSYSLSALSAVKWGAATNNIAVLAGATGAAAPILGAVVALAIWIDGADERAFGEQCAIHERLAGHPMVCTYTPSTR